MLQSAIGCRFFIEDSLDQYNYSALKNGIPGATNRNQRSGQNFRNQQKKLKFSQFQPSIYIQQNLIHQNHTCNKQFRVLQETL